MIARSARALTHADVEWCRAAPAFYAKGRTRHIRARTNTNRIRTLSITVIIEEHFRLTWHPARGITCAARVVHNIYRGARRAVEREQLEPAARIESRIPTIHVEQVAAQRGSVVRQTAVTVSHTAVTDSGEDGGRLYVSMLACNNTRPTSCCSMGFQWFDKQR